MFSRFSKKVFYRAVLIAMALSLLSFTIAFAASGALDTTFGDGGKVTTDISGHYDDIVLRMAIQSNGRIVAVGDRHNSEETAFDFAVVRYKSNGSLDTSFSGDGKLVTNFGGLDEASGVAIQPDGKIVVSGQKCSSTWVCDLAVARYKANGSLDTTFGSKGKKVVDFGSIDNGSLGGIAIQSDGKIVIGGYMVNSHGDYDFAVYRLKSNGALDPTFNGDGKVNIGFGSGRNDYVEDLLLQGSKIMVVGKTCDASDANCNFAVARLTSSGTPDTIFSGDGRQTTNLGANDIARSAALQSDGKLVVVGDKIISDTTRHCAVVRYTSTGSLDTTFNNTGKKISPAGYGCRGVVIKSNKIIFATSIANGTGYDFGLIRLKSNGALDTTFSGDGIVAIDFGGDDRANDIALQGDGKCVVAGRTNDGTQNDFALVRVLP